MKINILFNTSEIKEIKEALNEEFDSEIEVQKVNLDLSEAYDRFRNQYNALKILEKVKNGDISLLVVEQDIFVPYLNFCFGLAIGKKAVISTARLKQSFYGLPENEELFKERCKKEAVHEVGHMLGLEHCKDRKCVMFFSNSIEDTDNKSYKLCNRCKTLLREKRSQN